jgi:hypothetical protein
MHILVKKASHKFLLANKMLPRRGEGDFRFEISDFRFNLCGFLCGLCGSAVAYSRTTRVARDAAKIKASGRV